MRKKEAKRAEWMLALTEEVVALDESKAGRIDWDTATCLYNIGKSPTYAARRLVWPEEPLTE